MLGPIPRTPTTLFYSYAKQDEALREELEHHLRLLERQGLLQSWHNRLIEAGEDWRHTSSEHLENASIILLLICSDFLASDYCYKIEMQRALERQQTGQARVIPLILRPCDWQTAPFGHLQALPLNGLPVTSWKHQDEAFVQIAIQLRALLAKKSPLQLISRQRKWKLSWLLTIVLVLFTGIGIWYSLFHFYSPVSGKAPFHTFTLIPSPTLLYPQLRGYYRGTANSQTNATITLTRTSLANEHNQVKMEMTFQLTNGKRETYECSGQVSAQSQLILSCIANSANNFHVSIHGMIFADGHIAGILEATDTTDSTYDHIYSWSVRPASS